MLKKIKTCAYQMGGLVVWIIQIYILQLPHMLWLRFGSVFRWLAVGHGEGVWTLFDSAVVEH